MDVMADGVTQALQGVTADPLATPPDRRLASTIENLPAAIREKAKDMLVAGSSTRDVSAYLTGRGYKLSHVAVSRYKKFVLLPALEAASKVAQSQALAANPGATQTDVLRATQDVTRAVLTAGPLVQRASQLWSEVLDGIVDSKTGKPDLKARAALIQAGRGLVETEAKLLGVGSFGQQQATGPQTVIQIAIQSDRKPVEPAIEVCELRR